MAEQEVLVSDVEREQALARLREAGVDGRLTLAEFSQRLDAAFTARTRGELAAITADLPAAPAPARLRHTTERAVAVMGSSKQRARWRPGDRVAAVAVMGDVELDLRNAEVHGLEVAIEAVAVMGSVKIIVPPGVEVDLGGWAVMGSKEHKEGPGLMERLRGLLGGPGEQGLARSPAARFALVRVDARVVMGSVEVVHRAEGRTALPTSLPPVPPVPPLPPRPHL